MKLYCEKLPEKPVRGSLCIFGKCTATADELVCTKVAETGKCLDVRGLCAVHARQVLRSMPKPDQRRAG